MVGGPRGLCIMDRELYRSLILTPEVVGGLQHELSIKHGDGRWAHGDCVSWDKGAYINSGGGWVGPTASLVLTTEMVGGPGGLCIMDRNYTGAYIKLRRGWMGPWDCVSWDRNYTGAYIKLRRWLGGLNNSLISKLRRWYGWPMDCV